MPLAVLAIATSTVGFCVLSRIRGQNRSFQYVMNVSSASTAAPGRAIGSTTLPWVRSVEAPSARPASSSSVGIAEMRYCRMKNAPNALPSAGTTTPRRSFAQPNHCVTMMYSGMIASWVGTSMVATTDVNSPFRPRKVSLANAKPASVDVNTTDSVIVPATITEFVSARPKLPWSNAADRLSHNDPPGTSGGGYRPIADWSREDTTTDQHSGKTEHTMIARRG